MVTDELLCELEFCPLVKRDKGLLSWKRDKYSTLPNIRLICIDPMNKTFTNMP